MKNIYEVNPLFVKYKNKKDKLTELATYFNNSNAGLGELAVASGLNGLVDKLKKPSLVKVSDEYVPDTMIEDALKEKSFVFVKDCDLQIENVVNNMKIEALNYGLDVDFSKIKIVIADNMCYPDKDDEILGDGVGSCQRIVLLHGSGLFYIWRREYSNMDHKDVTFEKNPLIYDKSSATADALAKGEYMMVSDVFTGGCLKCVEEYSCLDLIENASDFIQASLASMEFVDLFEDV